MRMLTNHYTTLLSSGVALEGLDWAILIGFILLIVGVGVGLTRQASKSLSHFFLGGRNLPWLVVGVSMVATTFAADTPLAVTEIVANNGIAGNWLWWNFLMGGMLTTFFFARLWRKADVLTEVELIELRYSGRTASFLRGFKSVYLGVFLNVLIIGWVNLAMMTLLEVFFGLTPDMAFWVTGGLLVVVAFYSAMSGLLGVAITDNIQFVVAMVGTLILAFLVVGSEEVGGMEMLTYNVEQLRPGATRFFPVIGEGGGMTATTLTLGIGAFLAHMTVQWWASWYPGAEPGGGGYIAQRMMSAKNEKHSVYATLFFQIAHYCIRPWPWIIVGLAAITLYGNYVQKIPDRDLQLKVERQASRLAMPVSTILLEDAAIEAFAAERPAVQRELDNIKALRDELFVAAETNPKLQQSLDYLKDPRKGYVFAMRDFLPVGLRGLLLAAFFAAFMSTISTQLNWGASYLVNDLYKRFVYVGNSETHLVGVSRMVTVGLMALGLAATQLMDSISGVWYFLIECGAGLGLVLILRWYWWRINAWSELTATIVPFIAYAVGHYGLEWVFPNSFFFTVGVTTVSWLLITLFTKPEDNGHLSAFYQKVQPDGWWKPVRRALGVEPRKGEVRNLAMCWLAGVVLVYAVLFGLGYAILGDWYKGGLYGIVAVIGIYVLQRYVKQTRILDV